MDFVKVMLSINKNTMIWRPSTIITVIRMMITVNVIESDLWLISEFQEACQTVDASVYQSVLDMDDVLDNDYDDVDEEEFMEAPTLRRRDFAPASHRAAGNRSTENRQNNKMLLM
jgi:anionic cell wall polymer biosynthesis LytR-Cps2A-Psr (LCP) family protein